MTGSVGASKAGSMGPVSVFASGVLLVASPLMRGGNRHLALMVLEAIGTFIILGLALHALRRAGDPSAGEQGLGAARWMVLLSPLILALIYLAPIPAAIWSGTPGRAIYVEALREAGAAFPASLPLSVVPDATLASLLGGIPLVAAFLVGHKCSTQQLRWLARTVIVVAGGQVLLGLLQVSDGEHSPLFFGAPASGRPIGTFANSNHYANYLALALMLYIWSAWDSLVPGTHGRPEALAHRFDTRPFAALWVGGGLLLVMGILMTRSRGAILSGLPVAALATGWLIAISRRRGGGWRRIAAIVAALVIAAVALLGVDFVLSRFSVGELAGSAAFRSTLARTSLEGAAQFWPWGAGWGVYGAVYPRFQPPTIPGAAGYAHQDYVQMLFEGGIFAVILASVFSWLVVRRAVGMARLVARKHRIRRETVAAALSGLGLLGFLLHSLVEFNMHIPANAILASLLAGVYLKPLADLAETPP